MKIIAYNAISIDGFIATKDGNSDWVSETDNELFSKKVEEIGCVFVGRKTFEQFPEVYPIKSTVNIVLTKQKKRGREDNIIFVNSPSEAIEVAKKEGFNEAFLVGGGITNQSFLDTGKINEIIISVHPIVLGEGIKMFGNSKKMLNLEQIETKKIKEITKIRYKVLD